MENLVVFNFDEILFRLIQLSSYLNAECIFPGVEFQR